MSKGVRGIEPRIETERQPGRLVVSPSPVRGVSAYRLLRQFSESACIKTCSGDRASGHCQLRAG
jgi:hypothetical protein